MSALGCVELLRLSLVSEFVMHNVHVKYTYILPLDMYKCIHVHVHAARASELAPG